jgi:uncharacterized protein
MAIELDNAFTVPVPPEAAWEVLLDVTRIAPCMPGATVDEVDGDVVNGRIKVKVGPVSLTYQGTAKFTERDESSRTVQVEAAGKETRGAGTASATVKASLAPADEGATLVTMHTTMNVTGRPAQFGRGVMVDVGGKLVEKFAENLAAQLTAGETADTATDTAGTEAATGTEAPVTDASGAAGADLSETGSGETGGGETGSGETGSGETGGGAASKAEGTAGLAAAASTTAAAPAREDSLNLVRLVGPAILKRVVPVAAVAAALALLGRRLRRLSRHAGKEN